MAERNYQSQFNSSPENLVDKEVPSTETFPFTKLIPKELRNHLQAAVLVVGAIFIACRSGDDNQAVVSPTFSPETPKVQRMIPTEMAASQPTARSSDTILAAGLVAVGHALGDSRAEAESVPLVPGCQIKSFADYSPGTPLSKITDQIKGGGANPRLWFLEPGSVDFELFDPNSFERSDKRELGPSDEAGFVCVDTATVWERLPESTSTPETTLTDEQLIDTTEAQAAKYFWDRALENGFVRDTEFSPDSSIAATGFGLASLPVMAERYGENVKWTISPAQAEERARQILDNALSYQNQQVDNASQFGKAGFLYHFINADGQRSGESEVSTVDMALFVAGVLTAGQYFGGDIEVKANQLFNNVDWQYFFDLTNDRFYHAWKAGCGSGFGVSAPDGDGCLSNQQWDRPTAEIILINLLALAKDPTNEGFKRSLYAWPRVVRSYGGYDVVNSYFGSLFTYIYAHAFFDFERMGSDNPAGVGSTVQSVNWFENSWNAACANKQFTRDQYLNNIARYNTYGYGWGLSAAYRPDGTYFGDMGAAPAEVDGGVPRHDGTVPPYGAISTFPILDNRPCLNEPVGVNLPLDTLRNYWEKFDRVYMWGLYGPRDSFQVEFLGGFPIIRYSQVKYVGLDVGIEVLMLENHRSSLINNLFMSHPQIKEAVNIQFPNASLQ